MRTISCLLSVIACLAFLASPAAAEVKLPSPLTSHMVLQRNMPVPIWGTATPGEKVTVTFRDQSKSTTADAQGNWLVRLDSLQVEEKPATLTISATNTITLTDVLVGEVWVGSGQSNMDTFVQDYMKDDPILTKASLETYPQIRFFGGFNQKGWVQASAPVTRYYSAHLFYFGLVLHKELKVPVGLMFGAVRGSPSGQWLTEEAYNDDPAIQDKLQKLNANNAFENAQKRYQQTLADYEKAVAATQAAATQPTGKKPPAVPPKPWPPQKAGSHRISIGEHYLTHIKPLLPYAIRGVLWDQGEGGTGIEGVDQYNLMGALIKNWRSEWKKAGGQDDFPFLFVQKPSGGGCAYNPEDPVTRLGGAFAPLPPAPMQNRWDASGRENFNNIEKHPNTAMVITQDLAPGVHPVNKSGYATRSARTALGFVYGQKVEYSGPRYASHKIEGNTVRISFTHVGQGLTFKHNDKLLGFSLAGADKKFYWADAVIDGETVVLTSAKVPQPVAVRYAWAESIPWVNFFNKEGLPAVTFRTDDW